MNSSLQNEIGERLGLYLVGQISLSEFHDWLLPATWDIDAEEEQAKRLAHRIQLSMAEFSSGDRTEDELREDLWGLRSSSSVTIMVGASSLRFDNNTVTQRQEVPAARAFGTGCVGASV
jgi:hypothetical protein